MIAFENELPKFPECSESLTISRLLWDRAVNKMPRADVLSSVLTRSIDDLTGVHTR